MLVLLLASAFLRSPLPAENVAVRRVQGTAHAFLALRNLRGATLATGDLVQTVHGDEVTVHITFHFGDGSVDDEITVFTQKSYLHLLRDHQIQRGPSFPKPIDVAIDVPTGSVVSRTSGDRGIEKISKQHMDLPADLANGMLLTLALNLRPVTVNTTLPMVVPFDGIRIVHLSIMPAGTVPFRIGNSHGKAQDFLIKIQIGGLVGLLAPLFGIHPHDIHVWILEGEAPAFIGEEGQLYEGGPVWRIEQISPVVP